MKSSASQEFSKWDDALNEIYSVLKTQLLSDEMNLLKKEQLEWISMKDSKAKESSSEFEGGTMEGLEYTLTLASVTKDGCYELVELYMD